MNDKRKGLKTLMDGVITGEITDIAITDKDRLTRFDFQYILKFFDTFGAKIHIMNAEKGKALKAITVRQPWAIIYAGKDIENRNWSTKFRGRVAIHASKGLSKKQYEKEVDILIQRYNCKEEIPSYETAIRGAILGIVEIIDCVTSSQSKWFEGKYGFVLKNPQAIEPIYCRGSLSFWNSSLNADSFGSE